MKKLIFIAVVVWLLAACGAKKERSAPVEVKPADVVVGIGKVTPMGGVSNLAAPATGIVKRIMVSSGNKVKEGDVLLVLDNTDEALSLSGIQAKFETQQKQVQAAKLLLAQGDIRLKEKLRKWNDARDMLISGAVTGESVRILQNDYELEKQNQVKLQNDITVQDALLKEIASQKRINSYNLNQTELRAPMDGVVLEVLPKKGEAVQRYQTYITMAPDAPYIVQAEIDELFSSRLATGQTCDIKLAGDSSPAAHGKVLSISPDLKKKSLFSDSGQDLQDRRVRVIEVSLDAPLNMLIDTKVECTVHLD